LYSNPIIQQSFNKIMIFLRHNSTVAGLLVGSSCTRIGYDFLAPGNFIFLPFLFAIGLWLGAYAKLPRWTLWGLLLYLAAPIALPRLSTFAIAMVVVGLFSRNGKIGDFTKKLGKYSPLITGFFALTIFLLTLSPGLLAADAGELQIVGAKWGVAHPPGYPLYTMLANIVSHVLPLETAAWRVNLFSAITSTLTVALTTFIVRRETKDTGAGLLAGLILMVSTTFWMTSTQASIRPLTVLFTALMLEAMLAYRRERKNGLSGKGALLRFGIAAGLGVTHHGSIFFIGIVFALGIATADINNWRRWWLAPLAALSGLLPIIYLPLRISGPFAPDYLNTLDGIRYHITASGFSGSMFALADPKYWPERWQVMVETMSLQWHGWILPIVLLALVVMIYRDRWLGLTLLGAMLTHGFVTATYAAPQTVEYALPIYLLVAVILGCFVGNTTHPRKTTQGLGYTAIGILLLFSIITNFQSNWITFRKLSSTEEARIVAENMLDDMLPRTVILANWHRVTPLWYLQMVEGRDSGLATYYVTGGNAPTVMDEWAQAIEAHLIYADNVMITQNYPERYRFMDYTFEHNCVRNEPHPSSSTGQRIAIGPHYLLPNQDDLPQSIYAGETVQIKLDWDVSETIPFGAMTTFLHFGQHGQAPLTQLDLPMQVNAAGTVTIVYDLHIPSTVPPGEWLLFAGAYTPQGVLAGADEEQRQLLGSVNVQPARFPLPTQHPLSIRMGDARLLGWDYDTTAHTPLLYLHWRLESADHDYYVEVNGIGVTAHVENQNGYWTSVHQLPPETRDLSVRLETSNLHGGSSNHEIALPSPPDDEHYVLFENVAALIDWDIEQDEDETKVTTVWLAAGATYTELSIVLSADGADSIQQSITDSIPTLKWSYDHIINSQQTITAIPGTLPGNIRVSIVDTFTSKTLFISDTRLTNDAPGVRIMP
jgi:hypothetical protein